MYYNRAMLNIYCADALTNREKFIFDRIDPARKTILIVPDQYSLQAERSALQLSGQGSLLNLMVTDFNALGHKIVQRLEGRDPRIIDKYGRHMLLSVLISRMDEKLTVFRGRSTGNSFADQMNTMISELKRYDIGPDRLEAAVEQLKGESRPGAAPAEGAPGCEASEREASVHQASVREASGRPTGGYLVLKLEDMLQIYRAYEEAISGIYRDAEDYINYYADRIPESELVRDADIWIYGFDSFTPKNLLVIERLLTVAEVSVVMTCEGGEPAGAGCAALKALTQGGGTGLFRLSEQMIRKLEEAAENTGREHRRTQIAASEYPRESLWRSAAPQEAAEREPGGVPEQDGSSEHGGLAEHGSSSEHDGSSEHDTLAEHITLVQASGIHTESESAAAFIQSLVRDHGYRYGEIVVLCNDLDGRGRQLQRTFERWDIPAFADRKRKVLHQPVVGFLLSFLDVLTSGFQGDGIIGMIKSGLLGWSTEDEALIENYIREFRIRGSRWQQEFVWDGGRYSEEELRRLNEMRESLVTLTAQAKDSIGRRNTAGEKISGLVSFLRDEFRIQDRIQETVERQQALQLLEGAAETAQIWNAVCGIFDQIVQIIGEEKISNVLLRDMIEAGLETLEIGLVPASNDCVLIGTLQRSRPGRVRALIVTGANAGLLPLDAAEEGLLSRREKERLEQMDLEFAGRERIAQMEEQIAIYRMFSLPEERLYVSCSQSGEDGGMLRPSEVFRQMQVWQPQVSGDLSDRPLVERIGSAKATVPYLAEALRAKIAESDIDMLEETVDSGRELTAEEQEIRGEDEGWDEVLAWYRENDPQLTGRLLRGMRFDNRKEALGEAMADALYRGDRSRIEASASRLEKFSGCPFAHFIQYGLRARERRLFEVGGREIGDIYHQCMMDFSRTLEEASRGAGAGLTEAEGTGAEAASETIGEPTWQTITEEECRRRIEQILKEGASDYREGLFSSDEYSQFRMDRITEICGDIAWAMVRQVRQGNIRRMYFEEPFGRPGAGAAEQKLDGAGASGSAEIPPVDVEVCGKTVRIRGIIDRLDVMNTDDGKTALRIVDYKTGSNTIRTEDFESGYRLQLMVYMDAALQGSYRDQESPGKDGSPAEQESPGMRNGEAAGNSETEPVPAGVFYFKIRDFIIDGDVTAKVPDPEDPDDLTEKMRKFYRLEGIVVDDADSIGAMDGAVSGKNKAESVVIPVKYDPAKEGYVKTGGGTLLGGEEFRQLLEATNQQVERICESLVRGEIKAAPKRETKTDREGNRFSACTYCGFRSICSFDPKLPGCRYEDV